MSLSFWDSRPWGTSCPYLRNMYTGRCSEELVSLRGASGPRGRSGILMTAVVPHPGPSRALCDLPSASEWAPPFCPTLLFCRPIVWQKLILGLIPGLSLLVEKRDNGNRRHTDQGWKHSISRWPIEWPVTHWVLEMWLVQLKNWLISFN